MGFIRATQFAGTCLMLFSAGCSPAPVSAIPWRASFPLALELAAESEKPMLVYFNADWCAICRRVERETFIRPEVANAMEPFVPVMVDIDRQPWLAQRYQIEAVPAYLKIDGKGTASGHALGYKSADEMESLLNEWSPETGSP